MCCTPVPTFVSHLTWQRFTGRLRTSTSDPHDARNLSTTGGKLGDIAAPRPGAPGAST